MFGQPIPQRTLDDEIKLQLRNFCISMAHNPNHIKSLYGIKILIFTFENQLTLK